MTERYSSNIESKRIIDKPFPAEHPYSSHISRFALFPSFERSASAPVKEHAPTSTCSHTNRSVPDHPRTRGSLPAPVIVTSKTKGSGERQERIIHSAEPIVNRWHEHSFDQLPKYPGARPQVYYPTPPKLFAPNQDIDSTSDVEMLPPRKCNIDKAIKSSTTEHDVTGPRMSGMPTRVIGASCPHENPHVDRRQLVDVPANNLRSTSRQVTCLVEEKWQPPTCPPSTECRPCSEHGLFAVNHNCYPCPPRMEVVHAIDPSKSHHSACGSTTVAVQFKADKPHLTCGVRKPTLDEREEHRLLNGQDYINLPPDKCALTLHPAYNYPIAGHTYGALKDCNSCHAPCGVKMNEKEPDYRRTIREQHDNFQQMDSVNRWQLLESQTPAHDIATLRRKMALSSVKHEPEVFYDHEGRYQRERAGIYKTSYDPALLEYAMNAVEHSGGEVFDLTGIAQGALDVPTELNASNDEAVRRSRGHVGSVTQYNLQPTSYELFRPFDIAKTLQKRHLQPNASTADIRTQIMSAVNQDLGNVRAQCNRVPKTVARSESTTVCCDQHATSTGVQRSLAASLVALNCPPPLIHRKTVGERCPTAPDCDRNKPLQTVESYDLSEKPNRPSHFKINKPMSWCHEEVSRPVLHCSCPSKAKVLARFNNSYNEKTPDLRDHVTCGKRHTYTNAVHSQVLRGSALIF